MRKEILLKEVSRIATEMGDKEKGLYKHGQTVTPPVTESVLHATSEVIQDKLLEQPAIQVPHFGTFKVSFREGQENKKLRNPQTGETYFADTEDKYSIKFKAAKKIGESFNEAKKTKK